MSCRVYPVDRGPPRTQLALLQELHIKCIGCPADSCFLYPTFNTSVLRAAGRRPQPVSRQPIPFRPEPTFPVLSIKSQVHTTAKTAPSAVSVLP